MVSPNQLPRNDHPITVRADAPDNVWRARMKDNIDILWERVRAIIQALDGISYSDQIVSDVVATIITAPDVTTTTTTTTDDEFRHFASLIDFEYDSWELSSFPPNVLDVVFKNSGVTAGSLSITYNSDNQPTTFIISGGNTGTLSPSYNDNGYLTSMTRT